MFTITPLAGSRADNHDHVLVGLSPQNGRYKPEYIRNLISWLHPRFRSIDVVIPGFEAAYTLVAAGHPPAQAVHRARRAYRQLRNPAVQALADLGVPDAARHVMSWTRLHADHAYRAALNRSRIAYMTDPGIRRACREMTAEVVANSAAGHLVTDRDIDIAVRYVIAEIPLLTDGPSLFGTNGSVFVYHRATPLVAEIARSDSILSAQPGQAWAVVEQKEQNHDEHGRTRSSAALPVPAR
ncbi:tRNA-dependent cyclodipeptide synthase [Kutzneria sp. CA-103260]|uniref:tRNA-dependent cyclodipeptide synthase n=1 Tax=Kutzneria sp. CA-103260 TaxID=2802641 RepID=UPI001BA79022|nr:tRNA-dependent cyclodipeptide synthase [Kutzneria sp. CA-103260]QUQ65926.1 Cyclo(L-leucyl-L-leucyl) synthase [Kutzneria sp. CA-103260]